MFQNEWLVIYSKFYKNLYRFSSAKDEYLKIVNCEQRINNSIKTLAYLGLGDVLESENSINQALENYNLALDFADEKDTNKEYKPVYRFQLDNVDLNNLEENSDEWNYESEIVGFEEN